SLAAARAWWVLRWAGHPQVRVLDGGLEAWRRAGHPVTSDVPDPAPGDIRVRPGSVPVLDADAAAAMARVGVLLDARVAERYRGEHEPIDPVAGHLPGSVNLPITELLADDGTFLPPAEVRRRAAEHGVHRDTPIGTMCGSGVTAAQLALALHEAGLHAIPYVGSWSGWVADPSRPVATGALPG
ncbi:MAG TPA: rhodanese-like domain-containing protein, partial [Phycicoccus sp.]